MDNQIRVLLAIIERHEKVEMEIYFVPTDGCPTLSPRWKKLDEKLPQKKNKRRKTLGEMQKANIFAIQFSFILNFGDIEVN